MALDTYVRESLVKKDILFMTHVVLGYPSFEDCYRTFYSSEYIYFFRQDCKYDENQNQYYYPGNIRIEHWYLAG